MATDQRIIKTNQAIETAFIQLAQAQPINKITVTALAKRAHISRKTYYAHYPDIDALVLTLKTRLLDSFRQAFIPVSVSDTSTDAERMDQFVTFLEKNRQLIQLFQAHEDTLFLTSAHQDLSALYQQRLFQNQHFTKDEATTIAPWLVDFYTTGLAKLIIDWLSAEKPLSHQAMTKLLLLLFQVTSASKKDDQ